MGAPDRDMAGQSGTSSFAEDLRRRWDEVAVLEQEGDVLPCLAASKASAAIERLHRQPDDDQIPWRRSV